MTHADCRLAAVRCWLALLAIAVLLGWPLQGAAADPDDWYRFAVDEDALAGAPDRSALNRPITAADRVFVRDGHFFRVGPDGLPDTLDDSRVRLFGINLSFSTNFPSAPDAVRLAKRLRKAGFNAVRLHHMDFYPGRETDPPRGILTPDPYPTLNAEAVKRLRDFIKALANEGLYVNLNLYVSYRFRPDIDGVPAFGGGLAQLPIGAPVHVYQPRMRALQETYAREVIAGLGLAGNPALAMVEINNESSLLSSWQRRKWADAVPPAYLPILEQQWNAWLSERYGSRASICKAWDGCVEPSTAALAMPGPADRDQAPGFLDRVRRKLDIGDSPGNAVDPAEPTGSALRLHDFLQFLADTDKAYFTRMRTVIHEATDARVPVAGTQMSYGGVLNFDSHAAMDYIDEHLYIDHPHFPSGFGEIRDWSIRKLSLTGGEMDRLLARGLRRDRSKPFVLSEFNHPFPSPQSAEALPVVAMLAALQDWDGMFFFDYLNVSNPNVGASAAPANFTLSGDWGKYVLAGQSAQLFRQGMIAPLSARRTVMLTPAARRQIAAVGNDNALDRFVSQTQGIDASLAWQQQLAVELAPTREALRAALPAPAADGRQEGVVRFNAQARLLVLDAPRAWGVFGLTGPGWTGAGAIQVATADGRALPTSLLLTSLDDMPLAQSRRLLLTVGSATVGTQPGSIPPRPKELIRYRGDASLWTLEPDASHPGLPSGSRYATAPTWLARSPLCLRWRDAFKGRNVDIHPLDGSGRRMPMLSKGRRADDLVLGLQKDGPSPWYEIVVTDIGASVMASSDAATACPA